MKKLTASEINRKMAVLAKEKKEVVRQKLNEVKKELSSISSMKNQFLKPYQDAVSKAHEEKAEALALIQEYGIQEPVAEDINLVLAGALAEYASSTGTPSQRWGDVVRPINGWLNRKRAVCLLQANSGVYECDLGVGFLNGMSEVYWGCLYEIVFGDSFGKFERVITSVEAELKDLNEQLASYDAGDPVIAVGDTAKVSRSHLFTRHTQNTVAPGVNVSPKAGMFTLISTPQGLEYFEPVNLQGSHDFTLIN